jgi:hypothetical protein
MCDISGGLTNETSYFDPNVNFTVDDLNVPYANIYSLARIGVSNQDSGQLKERKVPELKLSGHTGLSGYQAMHASDPARLTTRHKGLWRHRSEV